MADLMKLLLFLLLSLPAFAQVESVKMHFGDDMRWADPNFDDSGWMDGNTFISNITENLLYTRSWVRYKVRVPMKFLDLVVGSTVPVCEVYVEGRLIGSGGSLPPRFQDAASGYHAWPVPAEMAVPGRVLTVVLRIWRFPGWDLRRLTSQRVAPELSVHNAVETPLYVSGFRSILRGREWAMAVTLLVLLFLLMGGRTQWTQKEFQLLAAYLLVHLANAAIYVSSYYLPLGNRNFAYTSLCYPIFFGLQLELIAHFASVRPAWWLRAAQALNWLTILPVAWAGFQIDAPSWLPLWGSFYIWISIVNLAAAIAVVASQPAKGIATRLLPLVMLIIFVFDARNKFNQKGVNIGDVTFNLIILDNIFFVAVLVAVRMHRLRRSEETAARLEGQFAAARSVQEMLLTGGGNTSPYYEIETVYRPAEQVGGDFFRIIDLANGGRLVVVGDVSGKGLRAAMLVSVIAGILLNRKSDDPAGVLDEMNRSLNGQMDGGFVTCCCALFESDGTVRIANAGQLAPYWNGSEMEVPSGLPLGVTDNASYEAATLQLLPGGRLVFLSDGVVEAANEKGELYGFDRTREISGQSAEAIAEVAKAWGQNDDITVVTVRRTK
jgi:sigma-B regulation protein RsbU (phosphoserine phosphatase)